MGPADHTGFNGVTGVHIWSFNKVLLVHCDVKLFIFTVTFFVQKKFGGNKFLGDLKEFFVAVLY